MAGLEREEAQLLPNWHSAWGKAKAGPGAQLHLQLWLQVSIWDMGQGQSWGTVTG